MQEESAKKEADQKTGIEYERFAERRRVTLEDAGAKDSIKQLEDLSKNPLKSES